MVRLYGLVSCDTCRRARKWLADRDIAHEFVDVRRHTPDRSVIADWATQVGWEVLLNRRGTTWRTLPEGDRAQLGEALAIDLMHAHPALIKRPVFVLKDGVQVGFDAGVQARLARDSSS